MSPPPNATNQYPPYFNYANNSSAGSSQFTTTITQNGKNYNPANLFLRNIPMTFIKSNNWYKNPNSGVGIIGTTSAGSRAVKRRS